MLKKSASLRLNTDAGPAALLASGVFFCLAPMAQAQDAGEPVLQMSMELGGSKGRLAVRLRNRHSTETRLQMSRQLASLEAGPVGGSPGRTPSRRDEPSAAVAVVPQAGRSRQVRGDIADSGGLALQSGVRSSESAAADEGRAGETRPDQSEQAASSDDGVFLAARPPVGMGGGLRPPPAEPEASQESGAGTRWAIPPIRWAGSVGYTLRRNSDSTGYRNLDQLVTTNLQAASYIYAPWMASVSGSLGLVTGSSQGSASSGSGDGGGRQSRNVSIVGSGNLDLFPASRFPFSASFNRSDSRFDSSILNNQFTETRLRMRQSYRSEDGLSNFAGNFDHSTMETSNGQQDTVNAFHGSLSTPIGPFANNFNGRYSVSERNGEGNSTSLLFLDSSHSYRANENFSLEAYSSLTDTDLRYTSSGVSQQSRGQYLQLGTSASWRPEFEDDDEQPLTLNGGLSYFAARTTSDSSESQSQRLSGNTSAFYRFSPNFSGSASGNLNYVKSGQGQARLLGGANSSVSYAGDPLTIGNFSYNWNTGGGISWLSGSTDNRSSIYTNAQLGHSLGRNYLLANSESVSLNLSQTVAAFQGQSGGSTSSLSNNAMASYRFGLGDRFNGSVTGTFSDTITKGASDQHYDSLSLGFNGNGQLSPRSSASVNLNFIWTNQSSQTTLDSQGFQTTTQRMTLAGSASYSHQRFAGVPGLRYTFLLTADTRLRDERMLGNVDGTSERARFTVDNRLDYRIGRLDTRLSATINEVGGKKNALLFFQVTRQIGAY